MNIKSFWANLPANRKKVVVVTVAILPVLFVLYLFLDTDNRPVQRKTADNDVETNLLTGSSAKRIGIEALAKRQDDLEQDVNRLRSEIKDIQQSVDVASQSDRDQFERLNQTI